MTDWCVLKTQARTTMRLATSLAEDKYEAWTPIEHFIKNLPGNVKRPVTQAMLAGYVFARAAHLLDLLDISRTPMRRGPGRCLPAHPRFWVLRENDGSPALVADCKLDDVRRLEARRTPASKAEKALVIGSLVKVSGGPYGGLSGDVEWSNCRKTKVRFNARHAAEFLTSQLRPDGLHAGQAAQDAASMVTIGAV
jgi:hypothetical protein